MKLSKYQRYHSRNKLKRLAQQYRYRESNKGKISRSNYLKQIRLSIFEMLSFECVRCGFTDIRALQIDHVNGGGSKERKQAKKGIYKHILDKIKNGSKEYQVLCANCNWIKRCENREYNRGKSN